MRFENIIFKGIQKLTIVKNIISNMHNFIDIVVNKISNYSFNHGNKSQNY